MEIRLIIQILQFSCDCLCSIDDVLGIFTHFVVHDIFVGYVNLGKRTYNTGMKNVLEDISINNGITLFPTFFIIK